MAIPAERYRVLEDLEKAINLLKEHGRIVNKVIPEVFTKHRNDSPHTIR